MTDTNAFNKSFRDCLSAQEQPWYDRFVKSVGREPHHMWEFINWSAETQESSKDLWRGIFGV